METQKTAHDLITENGFGRAIDFLQESDALELINIPRESYQSAVLTAFPQAEDSEDGMLMTYVECHMWALSYVLQNHKRLPSVHDVLEIHRRLMQNSRIGSSNIGNFRQSQVMIGNNLGANPVAVPYFMNSLCNRVYDLKLNPLIAHYEYEIIHPFVDGNGRSGRLFWLWLRLHTGGNIQTFLDACGFRGQDFTARRLAYHESIQKHRMAS